MILKGGSIYRNGHFEDNLQISGKNNAADGGFVDIVDRMELSKLVTLLFCHLSAMFTCIFVNLDRSTRRPSEREAEQQLQEDIQMSAPCLT